MLQRGFGAHTLCGRCNNDTGHWYGSAYVDWVWQAARLLVRASGAPTLYYPFRIFPLRVIKQVVCMFFSANGKEFQDAQPALVRFLLNRRANHLDPAIRIYAYFNRSALARSIGVTSALTVPTGKITVMSEVSHYPFGYVMTFDSLAPDDRLFDISHFADFSYDDWREFSLRFAVLPAASMMPADFRTPEEIERDRAANLAEEARARRVSGLPLRR